MKVVGLTGGIGSGKTFVANLFKSLNVPIYDSDFHAKNLMNSDCEIKEALQTKFGSEVYIGGELNRPFLADKIFNNKSLLTWINSIVHPRLQNHFEEWCELHNKHEIVIKEAAILIESGGHTSCDFVVVVTAPMELRLQRVIKRDGTVLDKVNERIKNQLTDDERLAHANFTIINDGVEDVESRVFEIYNLIIEKIKSGNSHN